ncbi:MAG: hypothetical protein O6943_07590 [Bacteroidetes bacterium]|nr:hypothetical protein [Bacteroidota bacterium]
MNLLKQTFILAFGLLYSTLLAQVPNVPKQPGQVNVNTSNYDYSETVETLKYANSLFNLYNEYNSHLAIDEYTNELVFTDNFSELRADVNDVEFRRSGENMGIYCKYGGECLSAKDIDTGVAESPKSKYTFGVKENDKAVPEVDSTIDRLNSMLAGLSGGSSSSSSGYISAIVRKNLKIINDAFDAYNNYETVFSVHGNMLHWDSSVANVKANLNDLTFYINYDSKWIVMKCVHDDCLVGSSSRDDYSMGLSSGSAIAPNIEKVLQAFNDLRREILTN